MILTLIISLFAFNFNNVINGQMQCRDESGKVVDWYVVYKFPYFFGRTGTLFTGFRYAYITSESKNGFTLSNEKINDPKKSIFGQTLGPLYSPNLSQTISYIDYNDQPPEGSGNTTSTGAHAKGVVATDETLGYWLIHSVPKFSSDQRTNVLTYPYSGGRYGQTALCISLKVNEISKVVDQLLVMRSNVFSMKISDSLKKSVNNIENLINKKWSSENSTIKSVKSVNGMDFTSFSKSPNDHVDLYSNIVATNLKTDLYVETWRKNPGTPLLSFCSKPSVENVKELSLKFENSNSSATFTYEDDHSKWAVAKYSTNPYVCIGDINRMQSQYKRGGGTTCFKSLAVWKYWNEWVGTVDKC